LAHAIADQRTRRKRLKSEPQKEHQWLQKLVGEWAYETESPAEGDKPAEKFTGTESVRSLGGLWVQAEGTGEMPGGGTAVTQMTLGFDPRRKRYVGTWIGSMMSHLWIYEGSLNEGETALVLESEGPGMTPEQPVAKYKDIVEFLSDDHRALKAHVQQTDGSWRELMTVTYRRKR
jgi:hypothetical protein